ncbi:MAG: aspartate--tRNA ligase [Acidobacteria bacterium]|jgi:aspartyl-tRNA synthetase|nr:aspartate--tRNA ligase [Acidobacteriota bacterium]
MLDVLGNLERTHTCGELRAKDVGAPVVLMGWTAKKRDFGIFTFIDLRDRYGVTQIVFHEESAKEAHERAKNVRGEFVIAVKGTVVARSPETVNKKLPTGEIEVHASEILILNEAKTLPFQLEVAGSENLASEETRLKYRYLDLRRSQLQQNLMMRGRVLTKMREFMNADDFIEIETPILLKSTPEGARDFIVPSRISKGEFFALPQSPQILKQLSMIAGLDKYFQIARCFRDEDLRADRQPEFTQLDIEMSFANQEMVFRTMEGVMRSVFSLLETDLQKSAGEYFETPFPRMTYADAMRRFGSDKPDLRFEMELADLSADLRETDFAPFASVLENKGEVKCIVAKNKADYSRKLLDELQEFVKRYGAGALAWIKLGDETTSSLLKVLGQEKIERLAKLAKAEKGDIVLIVAGKKSVVAASLGALRIEIAKRENLIAKNVYKPLWVTEFPMFEKNEDTGNYDAMHHPFTSLMDEDVPLFKRAIEEGETELLGKIRARAYDIVINGYEIGSGSIRIHQREIQNLIFKALGLTPEKARTRFGFFLEALEYGTPPHGGFAAGIERIVMILQGTDNIRDVVAFPKTASAQDLMMDSPGVVDDAQLKELGINTTE